MESNWNQPQDWSKDGSVISGITGLKTGAWTALFNAKETINGKSTDIILKTFTIPEVAVGNDKKITAERERFLVSAKLQQALVKDGATGWVNILKICDEPPSFTMPKCGPSLEDLIDHKVPLSAADLYSVLHCILQSLIELYTRHKRSHGDLKASNVLASPPGVTPPYKLADPTPKGESHSANDLYNLGLLLYRLIEHKTYDPLTQLTPSKNWSILGARRDRWIEFLHLLLSPNGCQDPLADVKKEALRLKPVSKWRPVALAACGLLLVGLGVVGYHIISGRMNKPIETPPQNIADTTPAPKDVPPELVAAYKHSKAVYLEANKKWTAQKRTQRYDHTKSFDFVRQARTFVENVDLTEGLMGYKSGMEYYDDATDKINQALAAADDEEKTGKALDQSSLADLQQIQQDYADVQKKWNEAAAKFAAGQDHSHSKSLADAGIVGPQPANLLDPATDPAARRLAADQYKAAIGKLNDALAAIPNEEAAALASAQARSLFQKAGEEYKRSKERWEKLSADKKKFDLTEASKLIDEARQDLSDPFVLTDDASYREAADKYYSASQKIEQALALAEQAKPIQEPPHIPDPEIIVKRPPDPIVDKPPATIAANTQPKIPATEPATMVAVKTASPAEIAAAVAKADNALKLKSYVEAFGLYKAAADLGSVGAMSNVGLLYETGTGTTRDYAQAAVWYKKAADHDYVPALVNLASLYQKGKGVDQNFTQALNLYKRAADLGNVDAMVSLGNLYENGQGTEQDFPEALKWYKKAGEKNSAPAITNIGVFYERGRGVQVDYKEAAVWYLKAANLNYAPAMNDLAMLYDNGKYDNNKDTKPNYAEALKWYTKAAGLDYAPAMCNLGALYDNGQGVPLDHAEALKWFTKAAQRNHGMAMYNLGVLYDSGRGTKPDSAEAITWYRKAAHSDDPAAQRLATDALNRLGFTP